MFSFLASLGFHFIIIVIREIQMLWYECFFPNFVMRCFLPYVVKFNDIRGGFAADFIVDLVELLAMFRHCRLEHGDLVG